MRVVVMAAALVLLAGEGRGCSWGCRPTNFTMTVESCGLSKTVDTVICEGQCNHTNPVYIEVSEWPQQRICNGEWSYEVTYIEGCPVGVAYPVARRCECTFCNTRNTDCERFYGDTPGCSSF